MAFAVQAWKIHTLLALRAMLYNMLNKAVAGKPALQKRERRR
jgi:hypothetical protein